MKSYPLFLLLWLTTVLLFSCNKKETEPKIETFEGVYEQIGYGSIVMVKDSSFVLYDHTSISCIPVFDGPLSVFGDNLSLENDTLKLQDGINLYQYKRLQEAPNLCENDIPETKKNDPIYNFEVLAENFTEHYAYFELRNVNWDSLYNATKSKITDKTSDAELYRIMEDMLDSFQDGHIGLEAPSEVEDAAAALKISSDTKDQEDDVEKTYGDFEIAKMVSNYYLQDDLKTSRSGLVRWGYMDDQIGYLQVNLMMGHANLKLSDSLSGIPYLRAYFDALQDLNTSEEHTRLEIAGIKETMDFAMTDFKEAKAVVLDVRFNGGGKDEVALEIMRYFNNKRQLVFTKKARMGDQFTPPTKVYLESSTTPFTQPVFVLTSKESASATEIMVLSTLQLAHVYRMGIDTEGVFSDVMEKTLPNGWEVGLSNEVYLDRRGVNYENTGIPPTIPLSYSQWTQEFYRGLANDLEADKQKVLYEVGNKLTNGVN